MSDTSDTASILELERYLDNLDNSDERVPDISHISDTDSEQDTTDKELLSTETLSMPLLSTINTVTDRDTENRLQFLKTVDPFPLGGSVPTHPDRSVIDDLGLKTTSWVEQAKGANQLLEECKQYLKEHDNNYRECEKTRGHLVTPPSPTAVERIPNYLHRQDSYNTH